MNKIQDLHSNKIDISYVVYFHQPAPWHSGCIPWTTIEEHNLSFIWLFFQAALNDQPVDPLIVAKIKELYHHNMRKASLIHTYITHYVKDDLFKGKPSPPLINRCWYPSLKDINNIISSKTSDPNDQVNLAGYMQQQKELNPDDLLYFRVIDQGFLQFIIIIVHSIRLLNSFLLKTLYGIILHKRCKCGVLIQQYYDWLFYCILCLQFLQSFRACPMGFRQP